MKTLPNMPKNAASSVMIVKYSQDIPTWAMLSHIARDRRVNRPPSTPTISTTKSTVKPMVASLDRARFFLAS